MIENSDKLIEIIEDRVSMELGYRIILEAAETKKLPCEGTLPTFNDEMLSDVFYDILQSVTGKKYTGE